MNIEWNTYKNHFDFAHQLKIFPSYFKAIVDGRKRHEVRNKKERSFEENQNILLREWNPDTEKYTGRELIVRATYISDGDDSVTDLPETVCVISIAVIEQNLEFNEEEI